MKTVNLEEILVNILKPVSHDCKTVKQDIHLALVFNQDVDNIYAAMREACNQAIELAAENADLIDAHEMMLCQECGGQKIDKQSILNTKSQII